MLQTRIKNRPIRCGIVTLALLAVLLGTPLAAEQTLDEAVAAYERRDYATAIRGFRVHAEQGLASAQYNLGLMYTKGEGVPEDDVLAYAWLNLAAAQGNKNAIEGKDVIRPDMTANQIVRAQELSATLVLTR